MIMAALVLVAQLTWDQAMLRPDLWTTLEADNGEPFNVLTSTVRRTSLGYEASVYIGPLGSYYEPYRLHNLLFDCQGHYEDITGGIGVTQDAPPRSVVGKIAAIACSAGSTPKDQARWQKFLVKDGSYVLVDMASINRDVNLGHVVDGDVVIDTSLPGTDTRQTYRWWFNCRGQTKAMSKEAIATGYDRINDIHNGSVFSKVQEIVCEQ